MATSGSGGASRAPQWGLGHRCGGKKLVHFICHRTHLVKEKFNLFIDDYSDTKESNNVKNQLKTTNQAS